jgi:hypothetical protein
MKSSALQGNLLMKRNHLTISFVFAAIAIGILIANSYAQQPGKELGYYNGQELTFTADLGIPQRVPAKVQRTVYLVVYPTNWQDLGLEAPQCDPCDHLGDGISFDDFHDHVLDAIPGVPGFTALSHVSAVLPNYSFLTGGNNPVRDAAISAAYAAHLPATSVDAVNDLLNSTAPDGTPLAVRNDLGIYIRLSVIGSRPQS